MSTRKKPGSDQPSMFGSPPDDAVAAPAAQQAALPAAAAPPAPAPAAPSAVNDTPTAVNDTPTAVVAAPAAAPAPAAPKAADSNGALMRATSQAPAALADEDNPWDLSAEELVEVLGADGLGDASAEDFRIGFWVFNVLNREVELDDGSKVKTRRDQWWNTLTNRVADAIEGVFVGFRKTHDFSRFNKKTNETERFCRSNDRVMGTALREFSYKATDGKGAEHMVTVKQGEQRPCDGCPQQEWRSVKDPETGEARNVRDCAMVRNLVFFDTERNEPGVIRFKKSSARAVVDWLSRYYIGKYKRMVPKVDPRTRRLILDAQGKAIKVPQWRNWPLYSFVWSLHLILDKGGNFAIPDFRKLRIVTKDEVMNWKGQAQFIAEMSQRVVEEADKQETAAGVGAEDEARGGAGVGGFDDPDAGAQSAADDGFDQSKVGTGTDETF